MNGKIFNGQILPIKGILGRQSESRIQSQAFMIVFTTVTIIITMVNNIQIIMYVKGTSTFNLLNGTGFWSSVKLLPFNAPKLAE